MCRFSLRLSRSHLFGAPVSLLSSLARRVDTQKVLGWKPLDVEAHYVSADDGLVSTTVGAVDGLRLVHGLPVRAITSHAGQRHYPGLFWSATTGAHVWYESLLELDRLWLADFDPEVEWFASQPLWLVGADGATQRRHVPDLLLRSRGGEYTLVDVKPAEIAAKPAIAAVFNWTDRLCVAKGWRYEVWSGAPAAVLNNVRFLGAGRRSALVDPVAVTAVACAVSTGMTIDELSTAVDPSICRSLVRPAILSLLWSGRWATDMSTPLSGASVISWVEGP